MKNGSKKRNLAITMMLATALTLSACSEVGKAVEKETAIPEIEGVKTISKAEQRAMALADKELAERAWKELTAEERLLVKEEPTVLPVIKDDSAAFEKALSVSKKKKQPLRVVYFKTHDEDHSGRLLVYGVGNEFVGKSERIKVTFANVKDMEKFTEKNKTVEGLEKTLKEEHKWGNPVFTYQYASIKDKQKGNAVSDLVFYEIGTSYYAVPHKQGNILHGDKEMGMWTRAMIEERFGNVLPEITN